MADLVPRKTMTRLKSRLTRAKNSGDPQKVLDACKEAFEIFDDHVYPDTWHTWNVAREDALYAQKRAEAGLS